MKKKILLSLAVVMSLPVLAVTAQGIFDFVAPVISDHDDPYVTPLADIGTIVYDNGENRFYGRDNNGWQALSNGDLSGVQVVYLKDLKTSGTGGGTATANTVQKRDLTTCFEPEGGVNTTCSGTAWISLDTANDRFTLQPGTYDIEASVPGYKINQHQGFLYNYSGSAYVIDGSSETTGSGDNVVSKSLVSGRLVITSATTYEIRHWTSTTLASIGLGDFSDVNASNPQTNEVFTIIKITKAD